MGGVKGIPKVINNPVVNGKEIWFIPFFQEEICPSHLLWING